MRANPQVIAVTDEIVFLVDPDDGSTTITNDAEAVVEWANGHYHGRRVVYRDTSGDWDEITRDISFVSFTGDLPV